ncbi:hypothetical protein WJX81_007809 [Elliptochloris bilobata]|uniref:Uncharacterized protein n=1 Tax=Elliptochloris bilobata TaxID=381761 RepID=A0AAW1S900_9CHLO
MTHLYSFEVWVRSVSRKDTSGERKAANITPGIKQQTTRLKLLDFPPLDLPTDCGRSCSFAAVPALLSQRLLQEPLVVLHTHQVRPRELRSLPRRTLPQRSNLLLHPDNLRSPMRAGTPG